MSLAQPTGRVDVSVLVPAKDEAENLPEFVRLFAEALDSVPYSCELVVVNDGSTDETGEVLWEVNLGSSVSGYPITYAVDGRQYVAVNTGAGSINLTPELRPGRGTDLFVFALPSRD